MTCTLCGGPDRTKRELHAKMHFICTENVFRREKNNICGNFCGCPFLTVCKMLMHITPFIFDCCHFMPFMVFFLFSRVYIGKRIATASTSSYWTEDEAVPGCSPVSKSLNHPPVVKLSLCIYCTPTFLFQSALKFCHILDVDIEVYTWCNVVALHHILTQDNIVPSSCHRLEPSR